VRRMVVRLFEIEKNGDKGAWNSGSFPAASCVTEGGMMMAESSIVLLHSKCL
jgi:hypothetical protein